MLSVYNPGGELSDNISRDAVMFLPELQFRIMNPDGSTTTTSTASTKPASSMTTKTWLMLAGASVLAYWFLFRKKKL